MRFHYHKPLGVFFATLVLTFTPLTLMAKEQAVSKLDLNSAEKTEITLYSDSAFISQVFPTPIDKGKSRLTLDTGNSLYLQPESLLIHANTAKGLFPASNIFWKSTNNQSSGFTKNFLHHPVSLHFPDYQNPIKGYLIYRDEESGVLQSDDGNMIFFKWQPDMILETPYSSETIGTLKKRMKDNQLITADFNLPEPSSNIHLSYLNRGISMENGYRLLWNREHSALSLFMQSQISNDSGQNYTHAKITLSSGSVSPSNTMFRKSAVRSATYMESAGLDMAAPVSDRKEDTQFISLPGTHTIEAHSRTLLNIFSFNQIPATTNYVYWFDGRYGKTRKNVEHPKARLQFKAPEDLPAGSVQLFTTREDTVTPELHGHMVRSARNSQVTIPLGPAYTIDIVRKRLEMKKEGDYLVTRWNLSITNHKSRQIALTLGGEGHSLARMKGEGNIKNNQLTIELKPEEKKEVTLSMYYFSNK